MVEALLVLAKTVIAGLGAALAALALNYTLLRAQENQRVVIALLGPVGEETFKTGLALLGGASLAGSHMIFGLAEGWWELAGRRRAAGRARLKPALAALAGHSLFGVVGAWAYVHSDQALIAWAASLFTHLLWNQLVLVLHHFSNNKT
ncbi:MAG: hypothetical protein PWQ18_86 [Clostridia bacterium]|nr:hypothetical protein [Clostridia bacterium]